MTKCTTLLTKLKHIRLEGFQKLSKVGLLVVAIITAILGYQLLSLKFDYDFEAFFPQNDPETIFLKNTDNDLKQTTILFLSL